MKFTRLDFWRDIEAEGIDPNRVYYVWLKYEGQTSLGHIRWTVKQAMDKGEFEAAYTLFDSKELIEYYMLTSPLEVMFLVDYHGLKSKHKRVAHRNLAVRRRGAVSRRTFTEEGNIVGADGSRDTSPDTEKGAAIPEEGWWTNIEDTREQP